MEIEFTKTALKDLKYWKSTKNTTIQKRISILLEDIVKHPFSGIGKPEALKYQLKGELDWYFQILQENPSPTIEYVKTPIIIYTWNTFAINILLSQTSNHLGNI